MGFSIVLHSSNPHFSYTPEAERAYHLVLALRFDEAQELIDEIKQEDPNNLVVHHLENYRDIFSIFISEDEALFRLLKGNREERLRQLQKGDPKSPWYLYIQADVRLQWALMRLRFGELLGGFNDVSKAYQLLERNQKYFPDFMPNKKDLGILHAIVGTVPDQYQWGVKLLSGLEGSIPLGSIELEEVLQYGRKYPFVFQQETAVLYAYVLLHIAQDPQAAWMVVQEAGLNPRKNLLHAFIMANIAMRTDQNDRAIEILGQRPKSKQYAEIPYLYFMEGITRLRRLEQGTQVHFIQYIDSFKGQNFIKEAYQKLGWVALLEEDQEKYHYWMRQCIGEGSSDAGPDKHALMEAQSERIPPLPLLKARLLFDGGYHQQAYDVLAVYAPQDFPDPYHQLEYTYRMGRVLHGMHRYQAAILFYEIAVRKGRDLPYFFACNAALQQGKIYEIQGYFKPAHAAYTLCLSLKPDEYRTGLHQSAKAGLKRLEGAGRD